MKRLYTLMLIAMLTAWASAKTVNITVDDASKVHMYDNNYKDYTLTNGLNPIEVEFGVYEYTFEPVGVTSFASITFNGEQMVKGNFGYRTYNALKDGTEIVINTVQPDINYTYSLEYTASEGVWTRVTVETMNGPIPSYTEVPIVDNTITVKAGSTVCLYADNPAAWDVTRILDPSGNEMFWTAATSDGIEPYNAYFIATADGGSVVTTATRRATGNATITVNITGYYPTLSLSHGDPLGTTYEAITGLHEGANTLSVPRTDIVRILSTDGTEKIVTYKAGTGEAEKKAGWDKISWCYFAGPFSDGGEINIVIDGDAPVVETFDATLTVDDPADVTAIYTYWSATATDRNETIDATLTAGRNTIKVPVDNTSAMVRLWLAVADHDGMATNVRYRAGAEAEWYDATEAGEGVYAVSVFSDGNSEIEVAYSEQRKATVSFTLTATGKESADVKVADITVDGTPADYTGTPLEVTEGATLTFTVTAPEDVTFTVTAGDETLEADNDGVYTVTADADMQIEVTYTVPSGNDAIDSITAAQTAGTACYYDLSGRRVSSDALAPGIYIRVAGGKADKVAVK